jgi:outer membrane protein OmpA-like peptidoglycan-associated protein
MKFNGCPDTDDDGVLDKDDQCPDIKGLAFFNGCPDSDGDSIIDQNDACPFNAGKLSLAGCPDQDEDGIADKDDNCPMIAGTRENKGCPFIDSDGDGIKDESDMCPGVKGPVDNQGCPYQDTDNDSIPDKDDDCPSIPGSLVFNGCPDTDADGISDKYDLCPTLPGIALNNGCPEIRKEEQEILNKAFSNLEFETGKSVIRKSSLSSLDELAGVMEKRSEFRLLLAGHTDDVGKPESNLTLSKNRTLAVKNYLVKKGINADRIKTEWYGQTKPIASNATPEGRQQNRRVEMNIVFE